MACHPSQHLSSSLLAYTAVPKPGGELSLKITSYPVTWQRILGYNLCTEAWRRQIPLSVIIGGQAARWRGKDCAPLLPLLRHGVGVGGEGESLLL